MESAKDKFIARLYREHFQALYRYALAVTGDREQAEDAAQQTFVRLCAMEELPELLRPRAWLLSVLKNVLRNEGRKQAVRQRLAAELPEGEEPPDPSPGPEEHPDWLRPKQMSEEDFALFKLVTLEGCTCAEAARRFGISESACQKRLQRTRLRLREELQKEE